MNRMILLLVSICVGTQALAQFSGTFYGTVYGDKAQMVLLQSESMITGKYHETGNSYDIKGKIENNIFTGELLLLGTTVPLGTFKGTRLPNGFHLEMVLLGVTTLQADFLKEGQAELNSSDNSPIQNANKNQNKETNGLNHDPAVVGRWIKEEVLNSGVGADAASLVTVYYLAINEDGTFVQEKETGGGGSFWSSSSKRESEGAGQWYTQDQVMYVKPVGYKDYVRLNAYLFHEGSLVFKTPQGKYLIWKRSR